VEDYVMAKLLDNEYSMVSFKTYKNNKSNTFLNILLNVVLLRGIAGSGSKEFVLTLTNNNLYIDAIGYDMTGQREIFYTEQIDRRDIKSLEVKKERTKEIITLLRTKGKEEIFIRDNDDSLNLAFEMAGLITKNAGN
jgi:hypothetical protein